jgi:hypothetical protein
MAHNTHRSANPAVLRATPQTGVWWLSIMGIILCSRFHDEQSYFPFPGYEKKKTGCKIRKLRRIFHAHKAMKDMYAIFISCVNLGLFLPPAFPKCASTGGRL